ncbi:hypothetical protein HDU79_006181 [Rhizoclosmatium sp. JEL0117]|nr:hypothetical protein HDU79_006181 [Rhizoclosmatium sp. JEL0117]
MFDVASLVTKGVTYVKTNLLALVLMGGIVLFIWWKQLIAGQADSIVCVKDDKKTPAPTQQVTLAALTRRALVSPSVLLKEAASLGTYHVKWLFAAPLVVASDPNTVNVVLSDKFIANRVVVNHTAKGVMATNGETHAKQHSLLVSIFQDPSLTASLIDHLHARLASETFPEFNEAIAQKDTLDLCPVFEELWVDVISLWVLGLDATGTVANAKEEIERREKVVEARRCLANLTFVLPTGIAWYFDIIRNYVQYSEYLMLPGSRDYLVRRNGKTKARNIINFEYGTMAKEFRETGKKRGGLAGKLLDAKLAALPDGQTDLSDAEWEDLFEQLEAIQTAAQSPLYSLTPHILYLLAHSPTHQKQIYQELSKVTAKQITKTHVQSLPSLTSFTLETLRLLPPFVTTYNRVSPENAYRLPGQWMLPKSTHIVVDLLSTLRNATAFGEGASAFQPERFNGRKYTPTTAETPAETSHRVKDALKLSAPAFETTYYPFSAGPFACPGQQIALDVVKVCVAEIVRRYEVVAGKGREGIDVGAVVKGMEEFGSEQGGVLRHLEGCPVLIKKRK